MAPVHVFCGLGNPGERYAGTPHNVGFDVADLLRERHGGRWTRPHPSYALARANIHGSEVLLVKPQTYMNLSGEALEALGASHPFRASALMVACDDIALPLGQIRVRRSGGDGGHNGLKSVTGALATTAFPRLRMGVGAPPGETDPADYVTTPMDDEALDAVARMVRGAAKCVEVWVENGINAAMNRFNRREPGTDTPPEAGGEVEGS